MPIDQMSAKRNRVVAFVPIKLNSQRLPGKNLLPLGGKPLCRHVFETLMCVPELDRVIAYCSDKNLVSHLPKGVEFLRRDPGLDGNLVKGVEIYHSFAEKIESDFYLLVHATSPFTKVKTIRTAIAAVASGEYDSAFSAERIQTFAWFEGKPINYCLNDVPRTQEIEPVWIETSGFYLFSRELLLLEGRRIGRNPYIAEVSGAEAIDIDERNDYEMARIMIGDLR